MRKNTLALMEGGKLFLMGMAASVTITFPFDSHAQPAAENTTSAASQKIALSSPVAKADAPGAKTAPSRPISTPICVGDFTPTANVNLPAGKSGVLDLQKLHLPSPAWLRTVGDTDVVQVEPLTSRDPRTSFFLFGKSVGSTNLMFQNREGRCAMVEVSVGVDTASVQEKLAQLMPHEKLIHVSSAADSLVLGGTVSDAMAVDKAVSIAKAYARKSPGGPSGGAPGGGAQNGANGGGSASSEKIINMLSIAAPQQVMLEVKVAEISKTVLDQLGANFSLTTNGRTWSTTLLSSFLSGSSGVISSAKGTNGSITVDAQNQDGLVKILAEPNIMAISGQEGSFLAGGKIFIPVPQASATGANIITLQEEEFGVGLRFTPTVLDGGRINLKVAPEVSELSATGAKISAAGTSVTSILPLITTRRAATTVQLFDGQSFAIGGLIKNNVTQNINAFPILGEIPVLGALFRSSSFQADKSELVFIITPRLVKPLPPDYALPTDHFIEPNRGEFFLGGQMEGHAPAPIPAPTPMPAPVPAPPPEATSQNDAPTGFDFN